MTDVLATEAEVEDLGPSIVRGTRAYALKSRHVDQTFLIEVARPAVPAPGPQPVIYVLDGNSSFALTAQAIRMMQIGPGALPQALIVGIGYKVADKDAALPMSLRLRDLTPCNDETYLAMVSAQEGGGRLPPGVAPGGGDAFLAFIEDEVKPFVAARYAIDATDQTLVGMSLGGLLTLHALFTAPSAFQRYLAASPSIWWNKRAILEQEAALAARTKDLPVHLFLSMGGEEEAMSETARMVSNLYDLEGRLRRRAYPGLSMAMRIFDGETHMSVFPAALSRGLRFLFGVA